MGVWNELLRCFETDSILIACKCLVEQTFPSIRGTSQNCDLSSLALMNGIKVTRTRTEHFDGRFETLSDGNLAITLSTLAARVRSRFTFAHELGHWMLRHGGLSLPSKTKFRGVDPMKRSDREEEQISDLLAAELLMPVHQVSALLQKTALTLSTVRKLSRDFEVSFPAALRRIADVSSVPFLHLNIVPNRFSNLNSFAEIDNAMFVTPLCGMRIDRAGTRFLTVRSFAEINSTKKIRLAIGTRDGRINTDFEVKPNSRPIPNCDLFATLENVAPMPTMSGF